MRSLLGHSISADGLIYWFLLSGFALTNSLVLKLFPQLFRCQLRGLLVGAALVAVSMIPQMFNWQIDYTLHSGQLWTGTKHVLATAIHKNHQPIGLYSHRGYAAFTLAFSSVLALVALQSKWIPIRTGVPLFILCSGTLSLADVRGATLSMIAGVLWLCFVGLRNRYIRITIVSLMLVGLISIGWKTAERKVSNTTNNSFLSPIQIVVKHVTSDRSYLWNMVRIDFTKHPIFGWGFNGYSMIDAVRICDEKTDLDQFSVIRLGDYHVYCKGGDGRVVRRPTGMTKAHNLVLDNLISVGIFGSIAYAYLLYKSFWSLKEDTFHMRALFIVYIVYTLTWYDCGQISHLVWWALSVPSTGKTS